MSGSSKLKRSKDDLWRSLEVLCLEKREASLATTSEVRENSTKNPVPIIAGIQIANKLQPAIARDGKPSNDVFLRLTANRHLLPVVVGDVSRCLRPRRGTCRSRHVANIADLEQSLQRAEAVQQWYHSDG